ncbi:MAG: DNA-deoxyinosine glycosylase [Clostridia bacterium]|nr:DNA-deoxyinosine glycosylase [Clostridia bacterium]
MKTGFAPVYDENSRLLILGSFPSVQSRKVDFYYGNKQNRFWLTICGFFGEEIPESKEGKTEFLLRRKIALWDMVTECEIDGSKDSTVRNAKTAELETVLLKSKIEKILLNGALAYRLFVERYGEIGVPYRKMQSTSPANPRFTKEEWWRELREVY